MPTSWQFDLRCRRRDLTKHFEGRHRKQQMNPSLATVVYASGIVGLFYLNRDKSAKTSRALWIPVIWFWILGSRAVSIWLGMNSANPTADQLMEGSPIDALIFAVLLVSGLVVIVGRGRGSISVMKGNWPIVLYFAYCLISVLWSDFPEVSLKRWAKATGDVVMALVVLTDAHPLTAVRRLFSRVGFILLPMSVLLIKYYPYLGRGYEAWTGEAFNLGVTTNKNILGVTTYILALGAFWQVLRLRKKAPVQNRVRQLLAQCTLLWFGVWVLSMANSATSTACFTLGCILMLMTGSPRYRRRPAAVHALVLTVVLLGGLIKITGADTAVVHALGRKTNLTGRASDIWPLLIPMAPNAVVGAGFESFWLGPRLQKVWDAFPNLYVNEAHNGYIELYLNLGVIGVGLVVMILVHGYFRSVAGFRIDPHSAGLILSYVLTAAIYSYTEAGFRALNYEWSFLMLFIVAATSISGTYPQSRKSIAGDLKAGSVEQFYDSSPNTGLTGSRGAVTETGLRC
jgi:exopolysaccharide production protein ExoQ